MPSLLSVVIPTLGREQVLLDTIEALIAQAPRPAEVLIVDQTIQHDDATEEKLQEWEAGGVIRWLRLPEPSVTKAMNAGLRAARSDWVLFLDDDIQIDQGFLAAHQRALETENLSAVAGQVLQPGEEEDPTFTRQPGEGAFHDLEFSFRSTKRERIWNGMAGNLCVNRKKALAIGGFDEAFGPPVAYRFETEFCVRLCKAGGSILFEPSARIYHLRASRGGTRSRGSHLTSASPVHGVGDYYFAMLHSSGNERFRYIARRPFREVATRFHFRHPWYIPVKFTGECRALLLAWKMVKRKKARA